MESLESGALTPLLASSVAALATAATSALRVVATAASVAWAASWTLRGFVDTDGTTIKPESRPLVDTHDTRLRRRFCFGGGDGTILPLSVSRTEKFSSSFSSTNSLNVVHSSDSSIGLGLLRETNEAKATTATGITVLDDNLEKLVSARDARIEPFAHGS